jgi:hypothetical protein
MPHDMGVPTMVLTTNATKRSHNAPALIPQLDDRVVSLVLTESHAACFCERAAAWFETTDSWAARSAKRQLFWHATCMGSSTDGPSPKRDQGYDIRNDQALPSLQKTINQKGADRDRTVRLRSARLAGVVAYAHITLTGSSFRFLQTCCDTTLS